MGNEIETTLVNSTSILDKINATALAEGHHDGASVRLKNALNVVPSSIEVEIVENPDGWQINLDYVRGNGILSDYGSGWSEVPFVSYYLAALEKAHAKDTLLYKRLAWYISMSAIEHFNK